MQPSIAFDGAWQRGAVEAFARELEAQTLPQAEIGAEICGCIARLARSLKAEYADALQAIDVQGTPVKAFAEQRGLSATNPACASFVSRGVEEARHRILRDVR